MPNDQEQQQAHEAGTPELDVNSWRHAMIPWKEGGRLYTYLIPPGIEVTPGDTAMVEGPKGQPMTFTVQEVLPHEPTTFRCKPICNVWDAQTWTQMKIAAGAPLNLPEGKPEISMHEDYPKWKAEAEEMFVEGR